MLSGVRVVRAGAGWVPVVGGAAEIIAPSPSEKKKARSARIAPLPEAGAVVASLLGEIASGRLSAIVLDLDNVLFRPRGFVGSEAQEWASTERHARSDVLRRRDADERRMVRHGFFELASGLTRAGLDELFAAARKHGVKIVGVTARPQALERRTRRILSAVGVEGLDRLVFTGGTGDAKVDRLRGVLGELGVKSMERVVALDDLAVNVDAFAAAGLRAIRVGDSIANYATVGADEWIARAREAPGVGERFELLVNAYAVARGDRGPIMAAARERLGRLEYARFEAAVAGLKTIVGFDPAKQTSPAREKWIAEARAALAGELALQKGAFAGDRWLSELPARGRTGLEKTLGVKPERLLRALASALVELDGRDSFELSAALGRVLRLPARKVSIDPGELSRFAAAHAGALRVQVDALRSARAREDVELFTSLLQNEPLSLEEVRRSLAVDRPHLRTEAAFSELEPKLAPLLTRDVDRLGREPNLLLAAHVAHQLATAPESVTAGAKTIAMLRRAYPFIPANAKTALPPDLAAELEALAKIPVDSPMFAAWREVSKRGPVLDDARMLAIDHALADKLAFYRHLILHEGARGSDIHVVWKNYSADPLVVSLAERCLGLAGTVAADDAELAALTKQRAEELAADKSGRPLFVHLMGVKAWGWLDELARAYPDVAINGVSHTTSDADELRGGRVKLDRVSASVMADSAAKIRYERFMFAQSFERLLERLPETFHGEIPALEERHVVLFGAAGKIIGSGVADALLRMKSTSADGEGLFSKITLVDPAFADPAQAERKRELEAAGFTVVAGKSLPPEVKQDRLLVINATAEDVLTMDDYRSIDAKDVAFMNLGTGQKGASMRDVRAGSKPPAVIGPAGHQRSHAYELAIEGRADPLRVYALGDGYPYNLTNRHPNPTDYSDFNNLLIVLGLHHAADNRAAGKTGAALLDLANVSFTYDEAEERPVVFFLPPGATGAGWPKKYDGQYFHPAGKSQDGKVVLENLAENQGVAGFLAELARHGVAEEYFASRQSVENAGEDDRLIKHFGAKGPSKTVQVVDLPSHLFGPEVDLKTSPKSDVAGDVLSFRVKPPRAVVVKAPPGVVVERAGPEAITLRLRPDLDDPAPSRVVVVEDPVTKSRLMRLEIPLATEVERQPTEAELAAWAKQAPAAIFGAEHSGNGHNVRLRPGDVFRVVLPETNGARWLTNPELFAGPWSKDNTFQLLESKLSAGARTMILRIQPGANGPSSLNIAKLEAGETYKDWSYRRGGSGADYVLNFVIER